MNSDSLKIILVSPQMGENIGAAARAMKNFGIQDLRIVNPRDGWPNEKAYSMAAVGSDIIERAKIFTSLQEAIADVECLYATTATKRDMNKDIIPLPALSEELTAASKIGIMFGRESSGLTNEELVFAKKIITIPTSKEGTSINLGQAVLLICYELFKGSTQVVQNIQDYASQHEVHYLLEHLKQQLDARNFFRPLHKKSRMVQNISNIFTRNSLSHAEVQTLRGIITSLSQDKF